MTARNSRGVIGFTASHDGYARQYGLLHERTLVLTDDGARIAGRDRLLTADGGDAKNLPRHHYDIRFHLHPAVHAQIIDQGSVRLSADSGETWTFDIERGAVTLEESIHFAGVAGPVRSQQIVVSAACPENDSIDWRLLRD